MFIKLCYFLRRLLPSSCYRFLTKLRFPENEIDYRKFFIARHLLKAGGSAIDGGAHVGYFTRTLAAVMGGKGDVFCFEPNPYVFKLLNKFTRHEPHVHAMCCALSNQSNDGVIFSVVPHSLAMNSTLEVHQQWAPRKSIFVRTMRLDELLDNGLNHVKLIKLDVEGHELKVLQGAEGIISMFSPWIIFEFSHHKDFPGTLIIDYFHQKNYFCIDLNSLCPLDLKVDIELTDVLAIPVKDQSWGLKVIEALRYF